MAILSHFKAITLGFDSRTDCYYYKYNSPTRKNVVV
nr:MAG TPA_asm: hypothetical protein [Caudoviricetes sp.]DAL55582.1 MAG TPA_asm: hypothetical protein [Caudoviricetes sp.]DAQ39860.1 MAG TPA: hypothetical protein [Bacteriophage sp.]